MRFFPLKKFAGGVRAIWQRWRGNRHTGLPAWQLQIENLLAAANPFANWEERANWLLDLVEWLRREPRASVNSASYRTRWLLDWLDTHRSAQRVVRTTLQKTLREASGPELFSTTGLPHEPAFFSELAERVARKILPRAPANMDLSALFTAMFPNPADAEWLLRLDADLLPRLWRLVADEGIAHAYRKQIDEALTYLVTLVVSVGISPAFRQRLGPRLPLQSTPFMALRREMEKYLLGSGRDAATLRSVRMLVAVCRAQTDRIYAHLDEHGVSVGLVYRIERMRAQLTRISRLIDLRASADTEAAGVQLQAQTLLNDLIAAYHHRSSIKRLVQRSFMLRARKMVERNAAQGEPYHANDRPEYRSMLKAAAIGGAVVGLLLSLRLTLVDLPLAHFFAGALAAFGYALVLLTICAVGGVLAARQSAATAPALAARMGSLHTRGGLRGMLAEMAGLLRAQAAALIGNLVAVLPVVGIFALALSWLRAESLLAPQPALLHLQQLSVAGSTPLLAMVTGVLLWLAGLAAGFADNWFALRRMRQVLSQHRGLVRWFGSARAARGAAWLERNLVRIAGSLALALLLGMAPVVAQFFGIPLDVRHVTFAAAALAAATASLGWAAFSMPAFWLALAGVVLTGILNIAIAFGCALLLAFSARGVPTRRRRLVIRAFLRRLLAAPCYFFRPGVEPEATRFVPSVPVPAAEPGQSSQAGR